MKKILMLLAAAAIAGCANTVAPTNASHGLVKLTGEPINCQFLYRLENEVSVYGVDDAEQHLRNKIADQVRGGNAYWVVSTRTRPNEWVVFGPERAFVQVANVYSCPDTRNIQTRQPMQVVQECPRDIACY